jgi:hypothetical protein
VAGDAADRSREAGVGQRLGDGRKLGRIEVDEALDRPQKVARSEQRELLRLDEDARVA